MWTKLALVGVIIGGVLGWLHLHDKEVKAKALAEQRRESLVAAVKVIADKNVTIDSAQRAIIQRDEILKKKESKLHQQAQSLDSLSKLDENILEAVKGEILTHTHVSRSNVIRLVEKYEDYTTRLKTQIAVKDQQVAIIGLRLIEKQAELELEREKNNNLNSINASLLKELNKPVKVSNSNSIWTAAKYVVPSVIITACIAECFQ